MVSQMNFQTFKEQIIPMLFKLSQSIEKMEGFPVNFTSPR